MVDDRDFDELVAETAERSGRETVTPEQHRKLKDAVFGAAWESLVFCERSYFVLGSYDDEERSRLLVVRDRLLARGAGTYAFLMDEFPEAWEFWTTKFEVLASRADYVVGVFEHSRGGHEWEAGHVAHERFRRKTHVLKREYETEAAERGAFDAMFAHFLDVMDELGRLYTWTDEDELETQVENVP